MNEERPMILADRLVVYVSKAITELNLMEKVVEDQERFGDYGYLTLGKIVSELTNVREAIREDRMKGKDGVYYLIEHVFEPHSSFVADLLETGEFPEFAELERECR